MEKKKTNSQILTEKIKKLEFERDLWKELEELNEQISSIEDSFFELRPETIEVLRIISRR